MQTIGYVVVDTKVLLVLVRNHKTYRSLKIRKGGFPGDWLCDEEIYLRENPSVVEKLVGGKVIKL
jgi:hypothetical protein